MNPTSSVPTIPDFGDGALDRAVELVHYLRQHCPWDAKQTPKSLIPHLLEEAHEVVDAIRSENQDVLEGELGDLLLNLAFQVAIGEESGAFDRTSVSQHLEDKMVRRHPHLFGLGEERDWEVLKAAERDERDSVLAGLAKGLDPLLRAHRIQDRVAAVGFDWNDVGGAWQKAEEELHEVRRALGSGDADHLAEELGDLLFAVVNVVRLAGYHSDTVLDEANRKFSRRFWAVEEAARERGLVLGEATLEELDAIWDEVKADERR
jgi:nucleoside triphosphate diphosphatase